MKNLYLFLLIPLLSVAQTNQDISQLSRYDVAEGLRIQNDIRHFYELEPYTVDGKLSLKAQEWANHLARTNEFEHSDDELGEIMYSVDRIYADNKNLNLLKDASLYWLLTKCEGDGEDAPYLQIISKRATKIGFGVAMNMEEYFVVAKYDSIYKND